MPRVGPIFQNVPGTTVSPNTTIESGWANAFSGDVQTTFNTAWPVSLGGTGGTSAITSFDAIVSVGTDVATAGSVNLTSVTGPLINLTGTTTITAVTLAAGALRITRAAGDFQITVGASLIGNSGGSNVAVKTGDLIIWEGYSGAVVRFWVVPVSGQTPVPTYSPGTLYGLTISNNVTDATNDIDIAVGAARSSADVGNIDLLSGLTKRLDAAWAVGTNQGGLDTGSIANAWYAVYAIKRPDTGVVDAIFSANLTAPTLPTNYTLYRRIGYFQRSAGAILAQLQFGDEFLYGAAQADINTSIGTSITVLTLNLPPLVKAKLRASANTAASSSLLFVGTAGVADPVINTPSGNYTILTPSAGIGASLDLTIQISSLSRIFAKSSSAVTSFVAPVYGWIDTRGRT